ncbi:MAG: hypothetical protein QHH26_13175 [Armatimonadota bacterium]|nr:hypothetical protein [Armatimonadota bacterium]
MRRCAKIALGVATLWPILFIMALMVVGYRFYELAQGGIPLHIMMVTLTYGTPLVLFTCVLSWALLIFYISHVARNEKIPAHRKRFWRAALFFGIFVVMPIYWYRFIYCKEGG